MTSSIPTREVLIFGGAGFVGSNLAHHLLSTTDENIHIFDNLSRRKVEHNVQWLQKLAKGTGRLKVTVADVRDANAVTKAVYAASEIYHFAAQVAVTTSLEDPRADFEVNAGGTLNILEAARKSGNRPFILFTSSNKVYGHLGEQTGSSGVSEVHPLDFCSPYGCSKGAADQYVQDYARTFGIPTVVFRMSCIAGPRQFGNEDQGWVAHFAYSALQRKPLYIYGDGHQIRDVLAVQDLVRAFTSAHENRANTAGQVYNVGGGKSNTISLLELIEMLERDLRVRLKYLFCPARAGDQPIYVTDFTKFAQHTGWMPERNVLKTVRDICAWYKQNASLFAAAPFVLPGATQPDLLWEIAS